MPEVLNQGWGELHRLPQDPPAGAVYAYVDRIIRLQSLFKPGALEVRDCQVAPLESGGEEYRAILQARQISTPGRMAPTETVVVRVTFRRMPPRGRHGPARYQCTHLSIGLVRLTDGIVKDRGYGWDITYSAFTVTDTSVRRVRLRDFPNGWRRTLRYAALSRILDWQLERCQRELRELREASPS